MIILLLSFSLLVSSTQAFVDRCVESVEGKVVETKVNQEFTVSKVYTPFDKMQISGTLYQLARSDSRKIIVSTFLWNESDRSYNCSVKLEKKLILIDFYPDKQLLRFIYFK